MKFIDPRIDFAFKKIFGSEEAKDILISFLESLLGLEGARRIADLTFLDPFLAPKIKNLKYSVLDVKCRDHRGISYIVEMQVQKTGAFLKRIQYNAAKTYVHQIERGEDYPKLNQVIAITIVDFILFDRFDHAVSRHASTEEMTGLSFLQDIVHYFIELPKWTGTLDARLSILDQWIYFIKFAGSSETIPEQIRIEPIRHAFEMARVANMTAEEFELYEKAGIAIADARGALELAREEGEKRGEERGERRHAIDTLRRLFNRKFGISLSEENEDRLKTATLEEIESWTDRILVAGSERDVFVP
ncbi:MAG: Rpn family recombination-promoting nuclease/putative transposase [Magnetococcus sp. THC-1_WYH]